MSSFYLYLRSTKICGFGYKMFCKTFVHGNINESFALLFEMFKGYNFLHQTIWKKNITRQLIFFPEKIFNVGQPQSSAIFTTSVWIFTQWQYFSSIAFYALLFAFMKTICNNNNLLDTLISFIRHLVYSYYEFYGSHFLPLCRIYSNSIN